MKHSAHYPAQPEFNDVAKCETCFNKEQKYIWSKVVRIEKLKKETIERKTLMLRSSMRKN